MKRSIKFFSVLLALCFTLMLSASARTEVNVIHLSNIKVHDKEYDGNSFTTVTFDVEGLYPCEKIQVKGIARFEDADAGTNKKVKVDFRLAGNFSYKYTLAADTQTEFTATIFPKEVTVVNSKVTRRFYSGKEDVTAEVTGYELQGVLEKDKVGVTVASAAYRYPAMAGENKAVDVTYSLTGDKAGNYKISNQNDVLPGTLLKRPLVVKQFKLVGKTYDGNTAAKVTDVNTVGLLSGDDVKVEIDAEFASADAGYWRVSYSVTLTGPDAESYRFKGFDGLYSESTYILAAPITEATADAVGDVVYNGAAQEPALTLTYKGMTLVKDKDYTVSYENNVNVGTAKIIYTGMGNFKGSGTVNFNITAAQTAENNTADKGDTLKITVSGNVAEAIMTDQSGKPADVTTVTVAQPKALMDRGAKTLRVRLNGSLYLELNLEALNLEGREWTLTVDVNREKNTVTVKRSEEKLLVINRATIPENAVKLTFDGAKVSYFDGKNNEIQ